MENLCFRLFKFVQTIYIVGTVFALFISITSLYSQQTPPKWFDTQYTDAIKQLNDNKKIINNSLANCGIPAKEAIAVVFPEMLRYTLWKNILETKTLEIMYVKGGSSSADFSIGWFQMKPSFAEQVEGQVKVKTTLNQKYKHLYQYSKTEITSIRKRRIARLKQFQWQLWYLAAFIDQNMMRFDSLELPGENRLSLLAAAYNRGMNKSIEELYSFSKTKTFPYGPGENNPFGYVELAEYFYINDAKRIFK